jgi:hypothetical protein
LDFRKNFGKCSPFYEGFLKSRDTRGRNAEVRL